MIWLPWWLLLPDETIDFLQQPRASFERQWLSHTKDALHKNTKKLSFCSCSVWRMELGVIIRNPERKRTKVMAVNTNPEMTTPTDLLGSLLTTAFLSFLLSLNLIGVFAQSLATMYVVCHCSCTTCDCNHAPHFLCFWWTNKKFVFLEHIVLVLDRTSLVFGAALLFLFAQLSHRWNKESKGTSSKTWREQATQQQGREMGLTKA